MLGGPNVVTNHSVKMPDKKDVITPDWAVHLRQSMAQGYAHGLGATFVAGPLAFAGLTLSPFLAKRIGAHAVSHKLTVASFTGLVIHFHSAACLGASVLRGRYPA